MRMEKCEKLKRSWERAHERYREDCRLKRRRFKQQKAIFNKWSDTAQQIVFPGSFNKERVIKTRNKYRLLSIEEEIKELENERARLLKEIDHSMESRVLYPHESAIVGNATLQALFKLRRELGLDIDNMTMPGSRR